MKLQFTLTFILSLSLFFDIKAESSLDTVYINLGWRHQFEFAGFYAAKELGFYKEQGIEVEFFTPETKTYFNFPKNDEFRYFVASASSVLSNKNASNYLIVSTIFQQSPVTLIVRKSSGINSLKELEGHKIGSGIEIKAMLKMAGANIDSIQFYKPTTDLKQLINRSLDGATFYINDTYIRDVVEKSFKPFRPIEYGVNFYGECLITTQQELEENPERVKKVRDATLKGWQFAIDNPEVIIEIIQRKYNEDIKAEYLKNEAEIIISSLVIPKIYKVGTSDDTRWDNMMNIMEDLGVIEKSLDLNRLLYKPEEKGNKKLQYFFKVLLIVLAIIAVTLLVFIFYNFQLKKAINAKTEELRTANAELESLNLFRVKILAIISHDARSPINSLKGVIALFNDGDLQRDELKHFLFEIESKLDYVNIFLDNILKWSKQNFDYKQEQVNAKNLPTEFIINKIVNLFSFELDKKNIVIEQDIADEGIYADENMFNTILRNLISNAIKFTGYGGVIKITTFLNAKNVKIVIEDNGIGMVGEQLQHIFTKSMISTKGSNQEIGTGLGLLLCKQYVELNHGTIGVNSKEGIGSIFWLELPKAIHELS